jgi:Asp-tRNA(Asn)/Glu-tRNA(Gln) amidotransferase A subunit family amidase
MLSALDLVRRIEAGTLTAAAVLDLCAEAINVREAEIGAFAALDFERAKRDMQNIALAGALFGLPVAGARVTEIVLPTLFEDAFRAHAIVQDYEAYRALAFEYDHHRDKIGPVLRDQLDHAATLTTKEYDAARRTTKHARNAFADLMVDTDVLLTPSAPGAAPNGLGSTGTSIFNRLWTLLGVPCVNVAGLFDQTGLPLGVQIVGRFGRDRLTLEAALFLERAIVC